MTGKFDMKDLGPASNYLRLKICCNCLVRILQLYQSRYIETVLKYFSINKTSLNSKSMTSILISGRSDTSVDKCLYQEAIR